MKKFLILLAVALAALFGWYLISPLFIDEVVDEEFPFEFTQETEEPDQDQNENETQTAPNPNNETDESGQETDPSEIDSQSVNAPDMELESLISMSEEELTEMIEGMDEAEKEKMEMEMLEAFSQAPDTVMEEEMTESNEPAQLSSGTFVGADAFHQGSGSATLYSLPDGSNLLRFEDFSVTNGPDLRIYLTENANPSKDDIKNGLELEKLKGNKGNQNYTLPEGTDASKYKAVVIYCKPFSVIFSVATLQ